MKLWPLKRRSLGFFWLMAAWTSINVAAGSMASWVAGRELSRNLSSRPSCSGDPERGLEKIASSSLSAPPRICCDWVDTLLHSTNELTKLCRSKRLSRRSDSSSKSSPTAERRREFTRI